MRKKSTASAMESPPERPSSHSLRISLRSRMAATISATPVISDQAAISMTSASTVAAGRKKVIRPVITLTMPSKRSEPQRRPPRDSGREPTSSRRGVPSLGSFSVDGGGALRSSLDLDAPAPARVLADRDGHFQHAVLELRLCFFDVRALGQRDAAREAPVGALRAPGSLLFHFDLGLALALENQRVVHHFQAHVFRRKAG